MPVLKGLAELPARLAPAVELPALKAQQAVSVRPVPPDRKELPAVKEFRGQQESRVRRGLRGFKGRLALQERRELRAHKAFRESLGLQALKAPPGLREYRGLPAQMALKGPPDCKVSRVLPDRRVHKVLQGFKEPLEPMPY